MGKERERKNSELSLDERFIIRRYAQGKKEFSGELAEAIHVSILPGFGEVVKDYRKASDGNNLTRILINDSDASNYEKQTAELISGRDFAYWFNHDENAGHSFKCGFFSDDKYKKFDPAIFFREAAFPIMEKDGTGYILVRDLNEHFSFENSRFFLTTEEQMFLLSKAKENESKPVEERDFLRWGKDNNGCFDESSTVAGYGPLGGCIAGVVNYNAKLKDSVYARWLFRDQLVGFAKKLEEGGFVAKRKTIYFSQRLYFCGYNTPSILGISIEKTHWEPLQQAIELTSRPYFSDTLSAGMQISSGTDSGELYGLIPEK